MHAEQKVEHIKVYSNSDSGSVSYQLQRQFINLVTARGLPVAAVCVHVVVSSYTTMLLKLTEKSSNNSWENGQEYYEKAT